MSNAIKIQVYSSGTTAVYDPGELPVAEGLTFSTLYPGGLYGQASFFIARDPTRSWQLKQGQRVTLSNGLKMVWEGVIMSHSNIWAADTRGRLVTCIGKWGDLMMRRRWRKRWADDRLGDDVWVWQTGTTGAGDDKCLLDRNSRLRFTPKAEAWGNGDYAAVRYTMPTGETAKKIKYSYVLAEGGQQWEIAIRNIGTHRLRLHRLPRG